MSDSINANYLKEYTRNAFRDSLVNRKCGRYGFMKTILLYGKWKFTDDFPTGQ